LAAIVEQFWQPKNVLGTMLNNAVLDFGGDSRAILAAQKYSGDDGKQRSAGLWRREP